MQASWTSASLGRSKKIPPLKNFMLTPPAKPKRQSWQSLYAVAAAWAAGSGIIVSEGGTA